jgi:hypothetical protein
MKRRLFHFFRKAFVPSSPAMDKRRVRLVCHCGTSQPLDREQSRLYYLGLWPARCRSCGYLFTTDDHPGITTYLEGR